MPENKLTDRILRPKEAARYLGVSPATLWRMDKRGDIKNKKRISTNAVGWFKSDLDAALSNIADEYENLQEAAK